jgi:hypothetical protein
MRGTFQNCGQNCIGKCFAAATGKHIVNYRCAGLERIIIHESIHDEFLKRIQPMVEQLRQGPPLGHGIIDTGATVMSAQVFSKCLQIQFDDNFRSIEISC